MNNLLDPIRHGLVLSTLAMIMGVCWAGYLALNHEQVHGGFEKQEAALKSAKIQQTEPDMVNMILDAAIPLAEAHGHRSHSRGNSEQAEHSTAHQHSQAHDHDSHSSKNSEQAEHSGAHQHSHSGSLAMDAMERLTRGHIHWMGLSVLSAVMLLIVAFTSLKTCWKKLLGWTFGIGVLAYPLAWVLMGFRTVRMGPETAESSVMWLFGPAAGLLLASIVAVFAILIIEMFHPHRPVPLLSCFFQQEKS